MLKINDNVSQLIGNTPLVYLKHNGYAKIAVKAEYLNPFGSIKDRVALYLINGAEEAGNLQKNGVIVEPTSGNTGIGLAAIGVARGYRVILTMPESMSAERRKLISAYGAEIILTPAADGMSGAIAEAKRLQKEYSAFMPCQFENPDNIKAHFETTGQEIYRDAADVDIFVSTVGTGGTFTGVARYLKGVKNITAIAVEPFNSPVLSGGTAAPHKIQGIGAGFVPENFDRSLCDGIITVTDDDAINEAKLLAKQGLFAGISSGAAVFAAKQLSNMKENTGKLIVTVLPDSGDRYISIF